MKLYCDRFVQCVPGASQRVDTERLRSVVYTQSESETLYHMQGQCRVHCCLAESVSASSCFSFAVVLTRETKSFSKNFKIISAFYFTCDHRSRLRLK